MRVDVFLAGMYEGDGVSYDALKIRDALRGWGIESELFTDHAHASPAARKIAAHYETFAASAARRPVSAVIYEYSALSPLTKFLQARSEPLFVRYQNVTPPAFYLPYDAELAAQLQRGRDELALLAGRAAACLSPSTFNAIEAQAAGLPAGEIVGNFVRQPPRRQHDLDAEKPRLLFIGRVAPNKCQHHLIQLAAGLKRADFPGVTLKLVGSIKGCPRYSFVVERLAAQAGNVHLTGHVHDPHAMYADADMFISASEHEGFGMPLVEAMFAGVPVVAYDAGAVAETVGGGGLVHRGKDIADWVELVGGLLTDPTRLDALRRAGAKRAEAFTDERIAAELKRALMAAGLAL